MGRLTTTTTRRLIAGALLVAAAAGPLAGCGDDEDAGAGGDTTAAEGATDETTAETTDETAETGDGGTGAPADGTAICDPYVELTSAFSSDEPPDPAALDPLLETLEAEAPAELADSIQVMVDAARTVIESGGEDFSAFEAPEFGEAQGQVDPYVFESCEFETKVEVTGEDYSFDGIPDEVAAGQVAMLFTNEGAEAHELALLRKADGVTESFEEILALGEEEGQALVEEAGGTFAPTTGSSGLAVVDLEAGDYAAICFIPVGTTVDETGEHGGTGAPHFTEGMVHEFTVTG